MAATERIPNLAEDDLLDAEVGEFLQNYLQLSGEAQLRDSGIRLDTSDSSSDSSSALPVTTLERLIRTHPIWFLPRVDRLEAAQILHLKETGNFIVRKCSQSDSTALSVKLGYEHGFVVDHFIIRERSGRVSVASSSLEFDTLLSLVYHHMSQVDSLPVVLALPSILRNTDTRQCLTSLALLGRDFWRYPMSNPGRQSLLIPTTQRASILESAENSSSSPLSITESRIMSEPASYSPSLIRRNINITPTTSSSPHSARHSFSYRQHPSLSAAHQSPHQYQPGTNVDSNGSDQAMMMHYFKSPTHDKISDYEDIWEKSPVPDPDLETDEMISPTLSEQRFKKFLFKKIFEGRNSGESQYESETETESQGVSRASSPSYPTCSSSEILCNSEDNDSASISSFSTQSSEINIDDFSEPSDPLAALELLTDVLAEDTEDELESFDCLDISEEQSEASPELEVKCVEIERSDRPPDIVSDIPSSKSSTTGSFTGLLRRLSLRRAGSKTRTEKRLSAVIGCYLTPSLLGMKVDDCQIDSSSWEFLDQTTEPGKRYFSEENKPTTCATLDSLHIRADSGLDGRPEECNPDAVTTLRLNDMEREKITKNTSCTSLREKELELPGGGGGNLDTSVSSLCPSSPESQTRNGNTRAECEVESEVKRFEVKRSEERSGEQRNLTVESCNVIKSCLRQLSALESSVLGQIVRRFICCTVESGLENPGLVMRNIRQVMTGLKNYLIITGEGDLKEVVMLETGGVWGGAELERLLEEMMQELVVRPLSKHLHCLLLQVQPGLCWQPPITVKTPSVAGLDSLVRLAQSTQQGMREIFSAGEKLELVDWLVRRVRSVSSCVRSQCEILHYLVLTTGWQQAGLESQYVWGLMDQTEDTASLWSVCLLAAAVYPLLTVSAFPILIITPHQGDGDGGQVEQEEKEVCVPCHPDITVTTILSLIMKQQHKQYSLSYRKDDHDIKIEGEMKGLAVFDLQQTEGVIISLRKRIES